jgi:hypothetical protein
MRLFQSIIINDCKLNIDGIKVIDTTPVSYASGLKPELLYTINEQRQMLGEEPDTTSGLGDKYLFELVTLKDMPKPIPPNATVPTAEEK